MTKFKKFLMAHGAILECNSSELARDEDYDVEFIIPQVLNSGLAINYCHVDDHVPDVVVYDRSGARSYIARSEYQAYVSATHCDTEYIDWLRDVGFSEHAFVFDWMKRLYRTDHEVRIAFKHMRAGIMSEVALCRLLARRYKKILGYYGVY